MMTKKKLTEFEKNKKLLEDICFFNHLVTELRTATNYRAIQLQNDFKDDEDSQDRFNKRISELTGMIEISKTNLEMEFHIRIDEESKYYGIIPELFVKYEVKYFIEEEKKNKYYKIMDKIQQSIEI